MVWEPAIMQIASTIQNNSLKYTLLHNLDTS
jgi:hypothetical protein